MPLASRSTLLILLGADLVDGALGELKRLRRSPFRIKRETSIFYTIARYALRAIPSGPTTAPNSSKGASPSISGPLLNAVRALEEAAQQNNSDALFLLADFNFYGNYSHPRNLEAAFGYYDKLASTHGNTTAQYMLGLYYSTGIGDVVPKNQAQALLYYTFAAVRGDARAEMATAYRHHSGIGVPPSCENAVRYYKRVADKAIEWYHSGPPGGKSWISQDWRIADDDGGIYGEGASASSAGLNAFRYAPQSEAHAKIGDVIEYLDLMSQKGDSKATLNLGRIYYNGQRGLDRSYDTARKYFFLVASRYWKKDGRLVDSVKPGIEKTASRAAGFIGRMYLRGEGMTQNLDRARVWFERGVALGDSQSQYGLGLMLMDGLGGRSNPKKAFELFRVSAEQDFGPAQVQMGQLYLDQGGPEDVRIANNMFELAARLGNIESHYYLAEIVYHGLGRERSCGMALTYYKSVAEKADLLLSSLNEANDAYDSGESELALLEYLMAAEQGYERAQTNVAYLLDTMQSSAQMRALIPATKKKGGLLDNPTLGLIYWTRSSRQMNIDSLVKAGDHYYYGTGTEVDTSKAVQCYTAASEHWQSAQALFNLGWMHENGIGLTQDFHLAKRYYDHALEVNVEAYLPVTLSLLKLRIRSAWNTFTHGPVHSIEDDPSKTPGFFTPHTADRVPGTDKERTLTEWIANFLDSTDFEYEDEYYESDTFDGAISGGDDDFDDSGVVESMLIIGVTMSLVLLLWWRQRMQQANAQVEDQRRRAAGLPPRQEGVGEPFAGWAAAGGVI